MRALESIGFIGGGRVTRFLLEAWCRADRLPPGVRVSDASPEVLNRLKADFHGIEIADNVGAAKAGLVILAVHPPAMKDVLAGIRGAITPEAVVLSLAPKVTGTAIQAALGTKSVVRMIPNAPSALGKGFNPVAYAAGVTPECRASLAGLFAPWGECPEVPEADLEAYAMLSAMGPTYLWFQLQTLRDLAAEFGLAPESADRALRHMARGAVDLLFSGEFTPAEVTDMVPVKPLKDDEAAIVAAYRTRLPALYAKIRP